MKQGICSRTLRLPNEIFSPEIVFAKEIEFHYELAIKHLFEEKNGK